MNNSCAGSCAQWSQHCRHIRGQDGRAFDTIPDTRLRTVRVGSQTSSGTPDIYVAVSIEGAPALRVNVYGFHGEESFTFQDAVVWAGRLFIGFGHRLHVVNLYDFAAASHELGSYFGSIFVASNCLLVASAERLYKSDDGGILQWSSGELGIDGVIVHDADNKTIVGDGECDPPGGWMRFRLHASSGKTPRWSLERIFEVVASPWPRQPIGRCPPPLSSVLRVKVVVSYRDVSRGYPHWALRTLSAAVLRGEMKRTETACEPLEQTAVGRGAGLIGGEAEFAQRLGLREVARFELQARD